jgi:hypothetical protein
MIQFFQSKPVDRIYIILAGQSNSSGEGRTNIPAAIDGTISNAFILNRNTVGIFGALEYSVNNKDDYDSGNDLGIGQEMQLAYLLAGQRRKVYFVKCASGGLSVTNGWNAVNGSYQTRLENYWAEAIADNARRPDFMVWAEGETSAQNSVTYADYYDDALAAFNRIRQTVLYNYMPIIQLRLSTAFCGAIEERLFVRSEQERLASENENIHYVSTDNVAMIDNNLHYDALGQVEISNRIYTKLQEIGLI